MINKTQIAELRKEAASIIGLLTSHGHQSFTLDKVADFFDDSLGKLEAAEARNALVAGGIEAAVKLQERAEKAEAELAKLKGDAVPVAWIMGDEEIDDFNRGREVMIVRDNDETELPSIPLFTHAQPVPVVVLHPVHYFHGNQYYSKYMVDKALEAAGITVKSADGEGD